MQKDDKHWFALYVRSRSEKKTLNSLLEKKIDAYCPMVKTVRQWSDRKKVVELPMLAGYVFINVDESEILKAQQTKGVVTAVKYLGKLAVIHGFEIERLRTIESLGYHVDVSAVGSEYKVDSVVKITAGPLKGIEGVISSHADGKYLEILVSSLGKAIRVRVPKEHSLLK